MDELAGKGAFEMIGPCMYSGTGKMPQGSCGRVHDSSSKYIKLGGRMVFFVFVSFWCVPVRTTATHMRGWEQSD